MGIETLSCPECGVDVKMGLPQNATIRSVAGDRREQPDDEHVKVRENACSNGHNFFVTFEY